MKNTAKNELVNPPFDEVFDCDDDEMDLLGIDHCRTMLQGNQCRVWIKDFVERAYDVLEKLYRRHGIQPATPLGIISFCIYLELDRRMGQRFTEDPPLLLTNAKLREETATAMP